MSPESWGFIGTFFGALVGGAVSILTTMINNRSAMNIHANNEKNEREERYRIFQRDNLLEIQEIISNSIRLIGKAHFELLKNYKEGGNWRGLELSATLDQEIGNHSRKLRIVSERKIIRK